MKLIILTRISLDDPTAYTDFRFYPCQSYAELENKVETIKNKILHRNREDFKESYPTKTCPYKIGYVGPEYAEGSRNRNTRICDNLSLFQDGEVFLVEDHSSYSFAYGITIRDLDEKKDFVLYEH